MVYITEQDLIFTEHERQAMESRGIFLPTILAAVNHGYKRVSYNSVKNTLNGYVVITRGNRVLTVFEAK